MGMSLLFLLTMLAGFAVAMFLRLRYRAAVVAQPSCGTCGYAVVGLPSDICPECGSDLRQVGIIQPGQRRPLTRSQRLLLWSLFIPLPALLLGHMLLPWIGPWQMRTTQQRFIFNHAPYLQNVTIRAERIGQRVYVPGWNRGRPSASPQTLRVSTHTTPLVPPIEVDLASGSSTFVDATGKLHADPGPLNADVITRWLNANGWTDPRVADRAKAIMTAIQEMDTLGGRSFSYLESDPKRGGTSEVVAHPTGSFTQQTRLAITNYLPFAVVPLAWLIGLPMVLGRTRVQSAAHADPARPDH